MKLSRLGVLASVSTIVLGVLITGMLFLLEWDAVMLRTYGKLDYTVLHGDVYHFIRGSETYLMIIGLILILFILVVSSIGTRIAHIEKNQCLKRDFTIMIGLAFISPISMFAFFIVGAIIMILIICALFITASISLMHVYRYIHS